MWIAALVIIIAATEGAPLEARPEPTPEYLSIEALQRYVYGRFLEEQGRDADALAQYLRAMVLDFQAPEIPRRASELSARLGAHERALEMARRSLRFDPDDAEGLWLEGSALYNLGRPEEALESLERAARADSNNLEMLQTMATVAEHLNRMDRVAWAFERIVAIDDSDGEAWFQLAAARAREGRFAEAKQAIGPTLEINPMRPGVSYLEGWIEEGLGHSERAMMLYREHLQVHPGDQAARRRMVNLLAQAGRFEDACDEARKVAAARPEDPEANEVLAELAFRAKRTREGQNLVEQMKRAAGDDPEPLERVIGILIRSGRVEQAIEEADGWARAHASEPRGALLAARARVWAGRLDEATEHAIRATEMAPDSLDPKVFLAQLYQARKHYPEAEAIWLEVQRARPEHVGTALDLAHCRELQGDVDGAEAAVRDLIRREPDNPTVLNFLGYLLADQNRQLDEALDLIGRAVSREPSNGAFVDSLGWIYYRLGRLEEARRELERAVALTGGDPIVREHLGDVYKDLQLKDLAREQYQQSLTQDQGNERVRAKLAELQ